MSSLIGLHVRDAENKCAVDKNMFRVVRVNNHNLIVHSDHRTSRRNVAITVPFQITNPTGWLIEPSDWFERSYESGVVVEDLGYF